MAESVENDLQGVLVVSCSDEQSVDALMPKILDCKNVKVEKQHFGHHQVSCYPWNLDTKYYTADIQFYDIPERDLISERFAHSVEAFVAYVNPNKESSWKVLLSWIPFIAEFNTEIKILLCNSAEEDFVVKRTEVLEWCIANEFELVELQTPDLDDDEDDDFGETIGVKRIIQALSAHNWPFMTMKSSPLYKPSSKFIPLLQAEGCDVKQVMDIGEKVEQLNLSNDEVNTVLENQLNFEDSFESLFSKFHDMKKEAERLSGDDRREYAEKVAVAFWKSMGGDQDDIADLNELTSEHDE